MFDFFLVRLSNVSLGMAINIYIRYTAQLRIKSWITSGPSTFVIVTGGCISDIIALQDLLTIGVTWLVTPNEMKELQTNSSSSFEHIFHFLSQYSIYIDYMTSI